MRALATILVLALVGAGAALAFDRPSSSGAELSTVAASGSFSVANSRQGEPIFAATDLAPGHSARGSVEIANTGAAPAELTLAQSGLSDTPGLGGALLSEQLALSVRDVTGPAAPVTVYSGPLAPMAAQPAGRIEPGEPHRYEFVATLPEATAEANGLQGASVEVSYSWTAREAAAPAEGPSPPTTPAGRNGAGDDRGGNDGTAAPPAAAPLSLEVRRVGRAVHRGRLTVRARCDRPCRISARGRLRARFGSARRGAKLRAPARPRPVAGVQRLRVRVPHRLLRWVRHHRLRRLRAHLLLRAADSGGGTAIAKRTIRLRLR